MSATFSLDPRILASSKRERLRGLDGLLQFLAHLVLVLVPDREFIRLDITSKLTFKTSRKLTPKDSHRMTIFQRRYEWSHFICFAASFLPPESV